MSKGLKSVDSNKNVFSALCYIHRMLFFRVSTF